METSVQHAPGHFPYLRRAVSCARGNTETTVYKTRRDPRGTIRRTRICTICGAKGETEEILIVNFHADRNV